MNRKHILFLTRWYPDRYDPMLGLFVRKHAQAVQLMHDVSVVYVTTDDKLASGTMEIASNHVEGIREIKIYFGKSRFGFINAIRYLHHYLRGIRMCHTPDMIHVHVLTRAGVAALYMHLAMQIPYVITEHWSRYLPVNTAKGAYSGFLRKLFTRLVVSKAGAVTTVTQNLADAMQSLGLKNRYFIIPNVVDVSRFQPVVTEHKKPIKTLIHVSCFDEPAKNVKGIIKVAAGLAHNRDDFELVLVGDGKDFKEVEQFAKTAGAPEGRIRFTGLLEGEQLIHAMQQADCMVMFSNYENLPCTILESLSCGVPVISTRVGGIHEHLKPEFGVLVPPGDSESLKNSLEGFLDGKITFDFRAMRRYAETHFSNEEVGKAFHQVYLAAGLKED